MREEGAGTQCELERGPEFCIHFHQYKIVAAGAPLELDQAPSAVLEICNETSRELLDSGGIIILDDDRRSAVGRMTKHFVMHTGVHHPSSICKKAEADHTWSLDGFLKRYPPPRTSDGSVSTDLTFLRRPPVPSRVGL